ncbi:tRNA wybutosine-synthesizing protein 2 [Erysiphe neolycopersici]|uniref:tRNA wybutosine-synthesizing protein 2 n=1 Tax=Erysiphe neolycopersici TaxID=212602 RepID=A0A420HUM0_9PEZI|nr:tRNA wybutosine-synthesizing protein 2 [Erysiphe neolycopersici]
MSKPHLTPNGLPNIRPKKKLENPIDTAIICWFEKIPAEILTNLNLNLNQFLLISPKRWVLYYPMVLLPSGSFESKWSTIFKNFTVSLTSKCASGLWELILFEIGKREGKGELTHLAINSGIPRFEVCSGSNETGENILRTPSGLIPLFGNFGPNLSPLSIPAQQDFDDAFWVRTKQNGIVQIWAPRYTMFSRGNFKEKERILKFHSGGDLSKNEISKASAVDLYAGIGYFLFSYVKMGFGKVFGWELNPWSVEGLRRGALANGWSTKVIRSDDELLWTDEKIFIFLENNNLAYIKLMQLGALGNIKHVNCGLLPSSINSWETALQCIVSEGWLHLHENVGQKEISTRASEIEQICQRWLDVSNDTVNVKHTELVKTFAPQIWHCVFDVYLKKYKQNS